MDRSDFFFNSAVLNESKSENSLLREEDPLGRPGLHKLSSRKLCTSHKVGHLHNTVTSEITRQEEPAVKPTPVPLFTTNPKSQFISLRLLMRENEPSTNTGGQN